MKSNEAKKKKILSEYGKRKIVNKKARETAVGPESWTT